MRKIRLWQEKIDTQVEVSGKGPPLVYLHGPWGVQGDRAFLELLARTHTVYAPHHPGTSAGEPEAVHQIDEWWDLIVYYGELFDRLDLEAPSIVGHSFGGMVASEIAATVPERVGRLVLIDPVGLWRDDMPVLNWMIISEDDRRKSLFADPACDSANAFFMLPTETMARADVLADFIWAQACTGKFVWPIPDKGLKKHIHRIRAPTLILWGEADGVIAPAYAKEFGQRIANSRVEMIAKAGHMAHLEQPDTVVKLVAEFLGG